MEVVPLHESASSEWLGMLESDRNRWLVTIDNYGKESHFSMNCGLILFGLGAAILAMVFFLSYSTLSSVFGTVLGVLIGLVIVGIVLTFMTLALIYLFIFRVELKYVDLLDEAARYVELRSGIDLWTVSAHSKSRANHARTIGKRTDVVTYNVRADEFEVTTHEPAGVSTVVTRDASELRSLLVSL